MAEKYTPRLEERARLRDEALLRKVAYYRSGASREGANETTRSEKKAESTLSRRDTNSKSVSFVKLMSVAVAVLWVNSFFYPVFSIFASLMLIPIFRNTAKSDSWRYGAYVVLGFSILFSLSAFINNIL